MRDESEFCPTVRETIADLDRIEARIAKTKALATDEAMTITARLARLRLFTCKALNRPANLSTHPKDFYLL